MGSRTNGNQAITANLVQRGITCYLHCPHFALRTPHSALRGLISKSPVPTALFWRRLIFSSGISACLVGCGGMYRVDSVFTANTLPNSTAIGNDDFYRKGGDSYQIDPNSTAFKTAFMDAHVKDVAASQEALKSTEDAFRTTLNALNYAERAIKEARDALSAVLVTGGTVANKAVIVARSVFISVDINPAKEALEEAQKVFVKDKISFQKSQDEIVKQARDSLDNAKNTKQNDAIDAAQDALATALTTDKKASLDIAKAAQNTLNDIQYTKVKPVRDVFEKARDIFVADEVDIQRSYEQNINAARNKLGNARKVHTKQATQTAIDKAMTALEMVEQSQNVKYSKTVLVAATEALNAVPNASEPSIKEAKAELGKVIQDINIRLARIAIEGALKELNAVMKTAVQTVSGPEEERARGSRNALISRILLLADDICLQHKANIQGNASALNLGFGTATTLFAGAGTLVTGPGAATLSALAAASNATRSLVNEEVYQKAFSASILLAIDSDRVSKKTPIIAGMKSPVADYPIEMAIQQINEYHHSCSFVNGIEVISKAVQQRPKTKAQIQSEIEYLRGEIGKNGTDGIDNAALKNQLTKLQAMHPDASQ